MTTAAGPHQGQPVLATGEPLDQARAAMVMVHGRGATAASILGLASDLTRPARPGERPLESFAFLAPQAAGHTWYPNRFLAPFASNEPYLSSALAAVGATLDRLEQTGIPPERTILLGFSQGACLALEYAARHARRYGGVVGLSGALIGPADTPRQYPGSLDGTPVFLGCSDADFHVPKEYVVMSAGVLQQLGGDVTLRLYPNMDHTVNQDEVDSVRAMMQAVSIAP